jgi:hypothetical protein
MYNLMNVLDFQITYQWVNSAFANAVNTPDSWFSCNSNTEKYLRNLLANLYLLEHRSIDEVVLEVSLKNCTAIPPEKKQELNCLDTIQLFLQLEFNVDNFTEYCLNYYNFLLKYDSKLVKDILNYITDSTGSPIISNWKFNSENHFKPLEELRLEYQDLLKVLA